ncbi:DUF819 domain-containing protein [Nonlabens tegetincola]|uniref:DUF819 domain-containing protein n=1 Tax=Nonlabens tegetincola TaxID=323273 RepID=A0A090PZC6_9FLAO|nr:DUF819 family protein [Nonlabens tegetincola]ARN71798.1 hypothetical protein BST91_09130 [Nonlabens tegetincola]GAK96199.1 DUF819 domain-containing protein [Nonlabens tegetincola]
MDIPKIENAAPLITNDAIVFGLLMICLAIVFYASSREDGFWKKFFTYVPALLMCYLLPSFLSTTGIISGESWQIIENGKLVEKESNLYYMASRYLLPAALVLMTLSIDLKAVFNLGSKALLMFLTGTAGIIIGGPLAVLLIGSFIPEAIGGEGTDAVWRGLATLAGSWIGGGANQTAMLEVYEYSQDKYGGMVIVDIVVANLWMAILLFGIGKSQLFDKWTKADNTAIEELKQKVSDYTTAVKREATVTDIFVMSGIGFGAVAVSHLLSEFLSSTFQANESIAGNIYLSFLTSGFFWIIAIATLIGILLSFTPAKRYEGTGASRIGGIFIYILVATIGMKMDLTKIMDNPFLILIGLVWMFFHAMLLIIVAKLIKAPYFFLAVGSQANVGGAASAPVVAAEFHPSLTSVGVLLAVFGYVVGTLGAIACTILMQLAATA